MAILKAKPVLHIAVLVPAGGKEQNNKSHSLCFPAQ